MRKTKRRSDLFQVAVPTINEHIKNIYVEDDLAPRATIKYFLIVQKERVREVSRSVDFYKIEKKMRKK